MWNVESAVEKLMKNIRADDDRLEITSAQGLQLESDVDRDLFHLLLGKNVMQYNLETSIQNSPFWAVKVRKSRLAPVPLRRLARFLMPSHADGQLAMVKELCREAGLLKGHCYSDTHSAQQFAAALDCASADLVHQALKINHHGFSGGLMKPVVDEWLGQWRDEISDYYAGSYASRHTVNFLLQSVWY